MRFPKLTYIIIKISYGQLSLLCLYYVHWLQLTFMKDTYFFVYHWVKEFGNSLPTMYALAVSSMKDSLIDLFVEITYSISPICLYKWIFH